jgi:hypothetical protein
VIEASLYQDFKVKAVAESPESKRAACGSVPVPQMSPVIIAVKTRQ